MNEEIITSEVTSNYIEKIKECFEPSKGIISLIDFKEQYNSELLETFWIPNANEVIEEYNLNFNKTKIKNAKELFIHFNNYSSLVELSKQDYEQFLFSFYLGIQVDAVEALCELYNRYQNTIKIIPLADMISNFNFAKLLVETYTKINNQNKISHIFRSNIDIPDENKIRHEINYVISKNDIKTVEDIYSFLSEIGILFKNLNLTTVEEVKDNNNIFVDSVEETASQNDLNVETIDLSKITEQIYQSLGIEDFLNPELSYIKQMQDKYTTFMNNIVEDSSLCSLLKTTIYASAFLARNYNTDFYPVQRMKNITDTSSRWAVGDEHNTEASFYGESEFVKAFSGYYSFMNGKRNPYYELINNNLVNYIDEEAMKMHKYFKENGLADVIYELLYEKPIVGNHSFYEILGTAKELIELIESPIFVTPLGIDLLSQIKGLVSSILNSVAQLIDFSLSGSMKQLFYVDFIPIGKIKISVADVYNYLIFLKLILEKSGDMELGTINREQFVSEAYRALGIREKSIEQIGYCAFDYELNDKSGLNLYDESLVKNAKGSVFTLRNDLKLLYSCIKFSIQKNVFKTGNVNYYYDFNYGDPSSIQKALNNLNTKELFYVFTLYGITFENTDLNYGNFTKEEILKYNENLRDITLIYNHNSTDFYKNFYEKNFDSFDKNAYYNEFLTTNYKTFINNMFEMYIDIMRENKKNIDKLVFSINDITDIDDFVMRVLPSIIEFAKTLGMSDIGISHIVKILDYCCYFISDLLFRNLFLKIKFKLNDMIKLFSDNVFNILNKFESEDSDFEISFNIGGSILIKKLEELMDVIDDVTIASAGLQKCFVDPEFKLNTEFKDTIGDIDFDHVIVNKIDKTEENNNSTIIHNPSLDNNVDYEDKVIVNKIDLTKKPEITIDEDSKTILDKIVKPISKPKKLIYNNGSIYIEDEENNRVKIVYNDDSKKKGNGISKQTLTTEEINKITNNNLNNFDTMIEIRDFIQNSTNSDIVKIINQMSKIDKQISDETEKRNPNFSKIQELQKEYQNLTNKLESAKKENNTFISNEVISKQPFYSSNSDIIISNDYEVDLQEKKELLEEVEEIVIKNNSPLTNFEIIQLLK